jgi:2-haloacid dehalogenase
MIRDFGLRLFSGADVRFGLEPDARSAARMSRYAGPDMICWPSFANLLRVKALFFDVFGTLVDWRGGVAREAQAVLEPLGHTFDWLTFADAWRAEYQPGMEEVRAGRIPFSKLDVLHRHNLERILPRFGLADLPETTRVRLNLAWHRLDAWPDVPRGLHLLKRRCLFAPVSNGNISLMVDLARRNNLPWDAILGSEIAGDYKPKPRVYSLPRKRSILPPPPA